MKQMTYVPIRQEHRPGFLSCPLAFSPNVYYLVFVRLTTLYLCPVIHLTLVKLQAGKLENVYRLKIRIADIFIPALGGLLYNMQLLFINWQFVRVIGSVVDPLVCISNNIMH